MAERLLSLAFLGASGPTGEDAVDEQKLGNSREAE
jgi:hypothetical protein